MRSRRTRGRYERVVPKPDVVIEEVAEHQAPLGRLEPSKARERRTYEPTEQDSEVFRRVVVELLESLEVEYKVEYAHEDYQRAFIEVGEDDAGLLIGKRGSGIDALETLMSRMTSHQCEHAVPVQADVNEYRKRREEELREDALVRARRVLETGKDDQFQPMSARDRRVVHLAVQSLGDELTTYSVGDGGEKTVVLRRADPQSK
jgi:spoIIIJ-associated protein